MRRLLVAIVVTLCCVTCFAQKDVTKFLGFPVDGPKSEMIKNLQSKGFKLSNVQGVEFLTGRFNGSDVRVFIVTEGEKVSRIMVRDENTMGETDIRIRFNRLCEQFENNDKYYSSEDYKISENENIGYEMAVHDKRYEAVFLQLPEGEAKEQLASTVEQELLGKYSKEQLDVVKQLDTPEQIMSVVNSGSSDDEATIDIVSYILKAMVRASVNKPVWFLISKSLYGKYYITMYYDNEYNRANGEDL